MKDYMRAVVDEGTATMLSGQSYSVAGKTGTAEYSMTDGEKITFLVRRLYESGQPELVISVIIEGYDGNAGAKQFQLQSRCWILIIINRKEQA